MKNIVITVIVVAALGLGFALFASPHAAAMPISTLGNTGDVHIAATLSPEAPKAGEETTITLTLTHADGSPANDLMVHHGRRVHVLLVSHDLGSIGHIHPDDFKTLTDADLTSGVYTVKYTFPEAGQYIMGIDVMDAQGPASQQFALDISGTPKMSPTAKEDFSLEKCFSGVPESGGVDRHIDPVIIKDIEGNCTNGYHVTLTPSTDTIAAGESVQFKFHVEKDGKPVTNLKPFLSAALHLALVPESLDTILHRHGTAVVDSATAMSDGAMSTEDHMAMNHGAMDSMAMEGGHNHDAVPDSFGPDLESESISFPHAGVYKIFAQFKQGDQIVFSDFMVKVQEPINPADAKTFNLSLQNRVMTPNSITVIQGDPVILNITTDEGGEFHLAGYEIEKDLDVPGPTSILFVANQAGRYNIEFHPASSMHMVDGVMQHDEVEIGALVVNPK